PRSNIGDTKGNPIRAEIDIRGEDALTYDVDCWAMLCKGKPAVKQKVSQGTADKHRQVKIGSAAKKQPFANRANAILVRVTDKSQEEQKTSLHTFYHTNRIRAYNETSKSSERSWFEITGFKVRAGTAASVG
ncbi:hypothetical protein AbraIFM66951_008158, partial [Aspergillus brasiliensis]